MNEDTKQYQIIMVFPPDLNPEKLEQVVEKTKQIIIEQEGTFPKKEVIPEPQLKRLSYPINKHTEAFYLTFSFSLSPQAMEEVNKQLNLEDNLIRHIITIDDKIKIKPKQTVDYSKMVEKIEPLPEKIEPLTKKVEPLSEDIEPLPEKITKKKPLVKKEHRIKAEIEDLDKKLEEILNN